MKFNISQKDLFTLLRKGYISSLHTNNVGTVTLFQVLMCVDENGVYQQAYFKPCSEDSGITLYTNGDSFGGREFGVEMRKPFIQAELDAVKNAIPDILLEQHPEDFNLTPLDYSLRLWKRNGFEETYKKSQRKYRHYDVSPIELSAGEDEPFIDIPQDYYEINTPFVRDNNGKAHPYLRKDGQKRKKNLYFNCCIRRLILPDITANDLLYSLCYDMWMRIDNSEDPITLGNLMDIVQSSLRYDMSEFKYQRPREKMVNPAYCKKYDLTKLKVH